MNLRLLRLILWRVLASLLGVARMSACEPAAAQVTCVPDTVGLGLSWANSSRATFLGKALGQTFLAPDTVITRITVWRWRNDIDAVGTRLFVTEVDTSRTPPRPNTGAILLNGPIVFVRDSDPPGDFLEMSFALDPPLALPRPGIYAFFLQREGCDGGETVIAANALNPYPHGSYWITGRITALSCALRAVDGGEDNLDLLFEIEFCSTRVTPVRARTWGELKLRYR